MYRLLYHTLGLSNLVTPNGTRQAAAKMEDTATQLGVASPISRFTLLEKIGEGTYGVVYRARDSAIPPPSTAAEEIPDSLLHSLSMRAHSPRSHARERACTTSHAPDGRGDGGTEEDAARCTR